MITLLYWIYFWKMKREDRRRLFVIDTFDDLFMKCTSPFLDELFLDQIWMSFKREITIRILTQGEKYFITMFSLINYEEQAIYYLIYLFGSSLPQLIFSTIEQISLNYFQQISFVEERTRMLNALTLFDKLLRSMLIICLLVMIFIIPHSSTIVQIYFDENLLKKYPLVFYFRFYLLEFFLSGMNLFSQSFVQSILSKHQYENLLFIYSIISCFFSFVFIYLFGITGILLIHCLNIFGRILFHNIFINQYLISIRWFQSYFFSSHYVLVLFVALILFNFNQIFIENSFGQLIFAIGLSLIVISLTLLEEKQLIHYLVCIYKLNQQSMIEKKLERI